MPVKFPGDAAQPHQPVQPGGVPRAVIGDAAPVAGAGGPGRAGAVDGFDGVGRGARVEGAHIRGPYATLAKGGDFSRTVLTPSGEIFVTVRVGKQDAGNEKPMVYLDGLAARRSRADLMADMFRDHGDKTVISVLLKGQGETLLKDLEKTGGQSIADDITDEEQAKVIIDVLDALGVKAPVDVFGLSYGGAIAAATAKLHPDRIDNALLVASHSRSQARAQMGEAAWKMATSPWNPWGNMMYRSAAKSVLAKSYGNPELFKDHPGAFGDALFRLSMGIDNNELERTTRGVDNVHVLVAEGDTASPVEINREAVAAAKSGSVTVAPEELTGKHDLVSADPEHVVSWVNAKLTPDRQEAVDASLKVAKTERLELVNAQMMVMRAAQLGQGAADKDPAEAVAILADAVLHAAAGAKQAFEAVPNHGEAAVGIAETAGKLALEAGKMAVALAVQAPGEQTDAHIEKIKENAGFAMGFAEAAKKALEEA